MASQFSDKIRNNEVAKDQDRTAYTAQMTTVDKQLAKIESAEAARGARETVRMTLTN